MGVTIAALASSHAYTFTDPREWEERRKRTRARYKAKYGSEPPEVPSVANETLETNQQRFKHISEGLTHLKQAFEAFRPDALILLGDDQDEHFRETIPQFAIYTGETFVAINRDANDGSRDQYRNHVALARHLATSAIDDDIDLVDMRAFPGGELISHAHAQILSFLRPQVPIVPIFLNAIHVPAPSPRRCYRFGETLRDALAAWSGDLRVAVYASGGLSHFSAGFPYPYYTGPYQVGSIAAQFDHDVVEWMRCGEGKRLGGLPSSALLDNGEIELRQWIALMGMVGDHKPESLVYEAFYRGVMGMAVGVWPPFAIGARTPAGALS